MTHGFLLTAFGRRGYYFAAANLACSLKAYHPGLPIVLQHDGGLGFLRPHALELFDELRELGAEVRRPDGRPDPALVKLHLDRAAPFDVTMALDVDQLALRPLDDVLAAADAARPLRAHTLETYGAAGPRELPHLIWAYRDDIWSHFRIPAAAQLPAINSSLLLLTRGPALSALFERARSYYAEPLPLDRLRNTWGGTQPDELYLDAALAAQGLDPSCPDDWLLLSSRFRAEPLHELEQRYGVLCLFGHANQPRPQFTEWYDRKLGNLWRARGVNHLYKWPLIKVDKHANAPALATQQRVQREATARAAQPVEAGGEAVVAVAPYYEPRTAARKKELLTALAGTAAHVERLVVVTGPDPTPALDQLVRPGLEVRRLSHPSRPTYAELADVVEQEAAQQDDPDRTVRLILNADCELTATAANLLRALDYGGRATTPPLVVCLSRHELRAPGRPPVPPTPRAAWSQDAWAWRGARPWDDTVHQTLATLPIATPACENRLAYELARVGLRLANPALAAPLIHHHGSAERTYKEADRLPGPVREVPPTDARGLLRPRLLLRQPGKHGDVLICLPLAYELAQDYRVTWELPQRYHHLLERAPYVRAVEKADPTTFDRVLDLGFGLGTAPDVEAWWRRERPRFASFVAAKYELARVPLVRRWELRYKRDAAREAEVERYVHQLTGGRPYALLHRVTDYGTPPVMKPQGGLVEVELAQLPGCCLLDWRTAVAGAAEVHCIDSALANLVEVLPEAAPIPKYYYPTDRVPHAYDRTTTANGWTERTPQGDRFLPRLVRWTAGRAQLLSPETVTA